jgi:RNA polymerase sigma-70 factor (ECF subfamily)
MAVDRACAAGFEGGDLIALIPQMRAFARSLCQDRTQADDLTQDALSRAWRYRAAYASGTNLKAWVFTILRNGFLSDRRRDLRLSQLDTARVEQTLVAVSNPIAGLELDEVRRAMLELPQEQREALTLVGVAGLSYSTVAEICDCSIGTVKSRVSRARRHLLTILSQETSDRRSRFTGDLVASMVGDAEQLCLGRAPNRATPPRTAFRGWD